jgi:hypothetical protein
MRKLGIIILLLVIIGASGLYFYVSIIKPKGFESRVEVIESFVSNIKESDVCDEHFIETTQASCLTFVDLLIEDNVTIRSTTETPNHQLVLLSINGNESEFIFRFEVEKVTGISRLFNKEYYLITYIE